MTYTKEQLQTQLTLINTSLEANAKWKAEIMSPEYGPAKQYGEGVRDNHRARVIHDTKHLQNRKIKVLMQLSELN